MRDPSARIGSKAARLQRMADAGLPVPPFVVLPDGLRRAFVAGLALPSDAADIRAGAWPAELRRAVQFRLEALVSREPDSAQAPWPDSRPRCAPDRLAVRSSMSGEDGDLSSFAGQLDSFLDLPFDAAESDSRLLAAIQACWASAEGARLKAYRRGRGLDAPPELGAEAVMAVILQRMVEARCSGVLFTIDPRDGDPSRFLISVAPGLGEDLVQGKVAGETFTLPREAADPAEAVGPLAPAELAALHAAGLKIEALFGAPQDIEFAFDAQGRLAILQARPVTAAGEASATNEPPTSAERILWDNSNITESYSGLTLPLTLSLIRTAYAGVYRQFLELMGVRNPDEQILQNLLGFDQGRVYYQLQNWYAALALLPAFEQNRAFMEQMMGLREPAAGGAKRASARPIPLAAWLIRMAILHVRSAGMTADFHREVGARLAEIAAMDLEALRPGELRAVFLRLEREVLGRWRAPILADFMAMIFFGLLRRLTERWFPEDAQLYNALLAGGEAIESLRPVERLAELARELRSDAELLALFEGPAEEAWASIQDDPRRATFRAGLQDYLDRYGDRCMNELKLEEPNLRDDPVRLIRMIIAASGWSTDRSQDGRRLSDAASGGPASQARARLAKLGILRSWTYRWILKHARRYLRDRENQRFVRSRVFGQLRRIFRALGAQFAAAGRIDEPGDIFCLSLDEIWSELGGTAISPNLRALVALRRAEYERFAEQPAEDRFETQGPPYWEGARSSASQAKGRVEARAEAEGPPPDLQGMGCCAGRLRGHVRVVRSVDEALGVSGEILVAEKTDPGWVFLFPAAAGLLVERGSPLSHSAIVARELGLPAIVNIPGLTARLRTGDRVEMDGSSGAIWILERPSNGSSAEAPLKAETPTDGSRTDGSRTDGSRTDERPFDAGGHTGSDARPDRVP